MVKKNIIPANFLNGFEKEIIRYDLKLNDATPFWGRHMMRRETTEVSYDMHYCLEMGIVLKGEVKRHYSNQWSHCFGPGQISFSGIWDLHGWEITKVPFEEVWMYILPEAVANMTFQEALELNFMVPFLVLPQQRPQVPYEQRGLFQKLGERLYEIQTQNFHHQQMWYRNLFIEILLHVYQFWKPTASMIELPLPNFVKIQPSIQMVFDNRRFISEKQAAEACRMGNSSFRKLFRIITGIGFSHFAMRHRINGVATDLLTTDKSIKEIAFAWGFNYIGNMDRCFTALYGCSPSQYRKQRRIS